MVTQNWELRLHNWSTLIIYQYLWNYFIYEPYLSYRRSEFKKAYLKKSNRRISKREIVQERQKTDYLENATSIERFYYISKQFFNSGFYDIIHF